MAICMKCVMNQLSPVLIGDTLSLCLDEMRAALHTCRRLISARCNGDHPSFVHQSAHVCSSVTCACSMHRKKTALISIMRMQSSMLALKSHYRLHCNDTRRSFTGDYVTCASTA
eukprot:5911741-Pleurochrysis_carterae.AAC.3